MSVDASISVYFPASQTTPALRALRNLLVPMPGPRKSKSIKIITPDGEKVALPYQDGVGINSRVNYHLTEEDSLDFDTMIDPAKGQDQSALLPVFLQLNLGSRYLEVSFSSLFTSMAHLLFLPTVRARIGELIDEGHGILAVSEAMGEMRTFATDEAADQEIHVPADLGREEVGVDGFAGFVLNQVQPGA